MHVCYVYKWATYQRVSLHSSAGHEFERRIPYSEQSNPQVKNWQINCKQLNRNPHSSIRTDGVSQNYATIFIYWLPRRLSGSKTPNLLPICRQDLAGKIIEQDYLKLIFGLKNPKTQELEKIFITDIRKTYKEHFWCRNSLKDLAVIDA